MRFLCILPILIFLTACSPPAENAQVEETRILPVVQTSAAPVALHEVLSTMIDSPEPSAISTLPPTAAVTLTPGTTWTATPTVQSTSTPTSLPTATSRFDIPESNHPVRICKFQPFEVDMSDDGKRIDITGMEFESENLLSIETWRDLHSVEETGGITPTPIKEWGAISSSRKEFRIGEFDLETNQIIYHTPEFKLHANPCTANCPYQVLSQSPDGIWQLVQAYDWYDEMIGIWLVSHQDSIRIFPRVPGYVYWEWAEDSSLLWFEFYVPEIEIPAYIVGLTDKPVISKVHRKEPIYPTLNQTAFSPIDKTILSVDSIYVNPVDSYGVHLTEIGKGEPRKTIAWEIPHISSVIWDVSTESYIYILKKDGAVIVQDVTGSPFLEIPEGEYLKALNASLWSDFDIVHGYSKALYALSPSQELLALSFGQDDLALFKCQLPEGESKS